MRELRFVRSEVSFHFLSVSWPSLQTRRGRVWCLNLEFTNATWLRLVLKFGIYNGVLWPLLQLVGLGLFSSLSARYRLLCWRGPTGP